MRQVGTGRFVDHETLEALSARWRSMRQTPFTAGRFGPKPVDKEAMEKFYQDIHQMALDMGLPEIEGWYGLDTTTGEFLGPGE